MTRYNTFLLHNIDRHLHATRKQKLRNLTKQKIVVSFMPLLDFLKRECGVSSHARMCDLTMHLCASKVTLPFRWKAGLSSSNGGLVQMTTLYSLEELERLASVDPKIGVDGAVKLLRENEKIQQEKQAKVRSTSEERELIADFVKQKNGEVVGLAEMIARGEMSYADLCKQIGVRNIQGARSTLRHKMKVALLTYQKPDPKPPTNNKK